jgi:hypothetical protein
MLSISVEVHAYLMVAVILGIVAVLCFLAAMFRREAVKRELILQGCKPMRVWWLPLSLDAIGKRTVFRVIYRDPTGAVHKARCYVSVDLFGPPFGPRRVTWLADEPKG